MANAIFLFDNQADSGIITASSTASGTTPASNVQNSQRSKVWRSGAGTTSHLNCALSSIYGVTHIALVDVNLTTAGTIRLQSWSDALGGSVPGIDVTFKPTLYVNTALVSTAYGMGPYGVGPYGLSAALNSARNITIIPLGSKSFSAFWRVTLTDGNTNFQQFGRLILGSAQTFGFNMSYGWQADRQERSVSVESLGGQLYTQPRDDRLRLGGTFDFLTDTERTSMLMRMQQFGQRKPFVFSMYPEQSNQGMTTTVYGCFSSVSMSGTNFNINKLPFGVVEEL